MDHNTVINEMLDSSVSVTSDLQPEYNIPNVMILNMLQYDHCIFGLFRCTLTHSERSCMPHLSTL